MKEYTKINNLIGWSVFLIAAITYLLTIEPTVSFWDCGEFIATTYKLEVGHPPGAPLFMILGRFFSLFAFGNLEKVAMMVNSLSALMSAFTILFLFWTITHIARKIYAKAKPKDIISTVDTWIIMLSGAVGALAYTFSDTFWFSAVEGEVYASSSFFTAIVFWAILKWENVADEPYANRWLILIAYLMGLSIGVHLLNLLAVPPIVLIYYFRKHKHSTQGLVIASVVAVAILGFIQYGIIPGVIQVASWFELLFTNTFGAPFNTGVVVYGLLMISLIVFGIYYSHKNKKVVLNTALLAFTVILIGYSSFAMIVIRSLANPPMDENNPENVFALQSYLNREQYGSRPLVYGKHFNAPPDYDETTGRVKEEEVKVVYTQKDGKYVITDRESRYMYSSEFSSVFPRMYSSQDSHIQGYKTWAGLKDEDLYNPYYDANGNPIIRDGEIVYNTQDPIAPPSFFDNMKFFVGYQIGHMYLRYFMWNFVGRQNDSQKHYPFQQVGDWVSGINFIDEIRVGDTNLPSALESKANNKYYFLPLLLGLIGLFFSLNRSPRYFSIIMLFFVFTGIAIIVYLNQTPFQPRERDYAYAGSFYVFAIWIGFGVLSLFNFAKKRVAEKAHLPLAVGTGLACMLLVPVNMAAENWDDHDRSGRYSARDLALNYLESCEPNAILFTYGDNDTFPLWYVQEVEGKRTDVRVVNLSLLNTDWYINQMRCKAYDSDPVPFTFEKSQYEQGTRDFLRVVETWTEYTELSKIMSVVKSDNPKAKIKYGDDLINFVPAKKMKITVDSMAVVRNKVISKANENKIEKEIKWQINNRYIEKKDMMILDLLAVNNWKRPIYFAASIGAENFLGLEDYLRLDGFAYKFTPVKSQSLSGYGYINTDVLYNNLMNKFKWGRINEDDVYIDEQNRRTTKVIGIQNIFSRLAHTLVDEQKNDKAVEVLDKCISLFPNKKFPYNEDIIPLIEGYYRAMANEKGDKVGAELLASIKEQILYFSTLSEKQEMLARYKLGNMYDLTKRLILTFDSFRREQLKSEAENCQRIILRNIE